MNVRLDIDEMDLTVAESKATYEEIKKYVAEYNDGMKVSDSCRVESGIICMECKKR